MGHSQGKQWFMDRMDEQGLTLSEVARRLGIDKSALSRALDGKRQVKPLEIGKIATNLGATREEVIEHLESIANVSARKEERQSKVSRTDAAPFDRPESVPHGGSASSGATAGKRSLHPGIGFMRGLIKIKPGFDVTGPFSDESWEDGYLGEDRLGEDYVRKAQK